MANISQIKLPNGTTYDIKDSKALPLSGGTVTGPVAFEDSVTASYATISDITAETLTVSSTASFASNLQVNTINGVTVGQNPKFTDSYPIVRGSNDAVTGYPVLFSSLPTSADLSSVNDTKAFALETSTGPRQVLRLGLTHNDEGSSGGIKFVNTGRAAGGYTTITPSATASADLSLPSSSGTIALVSEIPNVPSWALASTKPTYTASEVGAATSNHTHSTTIAASTATNQITLDFGNKYSLNAGETSYVFTMPSLPIYDGTVV